MIYTASNLPIKPAVITSPYFGRKGHIAVQPRPEFVRGATDSFTYSNAGLTEQATVKSLQGAGQIFPEMLDMVKTAESSLVLNFYTIQFPERYRKNRSAPGTPGRDEQGQFISELIEAHKRGVKVFVIMDNHKDDIFDEPQNKRTFAKLKEAGIPTIAYPLYTQASINHPKYIIKDADKRGREKAIISTTNLGIHSPSNHDAAFVLQGPDVRNLYHQVFVPDWMTAQYSKKAKRQDLFFRPYLETSPLSWEEETNKLPRVPFSIYKGKAQILQTAGTESVTGPRDDFYQEIPKFIRGAKDRFDIQAFVLTQPDIAQIILTEHRRLKAEGKRGARILVDPGLYFKFPYCRAQIVELAKAGVPIRFYNANQATGEKLHAKWAQRDGESVLGGSANWSTVGLMSNGLSEGTRKTLVRRFAKSIDEQTMAPSIKALYAEFLQNTREAARVPHDNADSVVALAKQQLLNQLLQTTRTGRPVTSAGQVKLALKNAGIPPEKIEANSQRIERIFEGKNHEVGVKIDSPALAQNFEAQMDLDWIRHSRPIVEKVNDRWALVFAEH